MIIEHIGDLLNVTKGIIVQGCNCQGVMGKGVAKSIKDKWPHIHMMYRSWYTTMGLRLGMVQSISSSLYDGDRDNNQVNYYSDQLPRDVILVNAMTQYDYYKYNPNTDNEANRDKLYADYDAVAACFAAIKILARDTKLPVHFPLIGCGLANGDWSRVSEIIESALGPDIEKHLWRLA